MSRSVLRIVVLALLLTAAGVAAGAVFLPFAGGFGLHIIGALSRDDVPKLKKLVDASPVPDGKTRMMVYVNSSGGDWYAAMAMGRLLRASQSAVVLQSRESSCLSACVLLLAGATTRIIEEGAKVGIHRPYLASTEPTDYAEAQKRYRQLERDAREYLREMNMPESLWDAMVSTPPENMRILRQGELEGFRLVGKDPAAQEVEDAEVARKYGLTKDAYFARKSQSWPKCGHLSITEEDVGTDRAIPKMRAYNECGDAVLRGLR